MSNYFLGNRYITRGSLEVLGTPLITELWKLLDQLIHANQMKLDYLQIFQIETQNLNNQYSLIITHKQEHPEYETKRKIKVNHPLHMNQKVYIISDQDEEGNEYSTLLLASEY